MRLYWRGRLQPRVCARPDSNLNRIQIPIIRTTGPGSKSSRRTSCANKSERTNTMKKITRREVLAGLASAPIVHGVINPVLKHVGHSKCSPTRLLKVYVHGAAVLDFRPPHIHVLFPSVFADVANSVYAHEY